ncbi:putative sugar O-methyltransferase [Nisaea acidiphila]|uniref:Sugar O-methyltransferase n=1 Tax=Nisaea acidiphila TaxID=1862145 RepID=A0A9J7B0M3_9PROT|nr:putative sugar O-methyltransferase [Nisaea acidiphila]UUX52201.1 putative sugar O-methyltransferase [Nisaea acidiphila]
MSDTEFCLPFGQKFWKGRKYSTTSFWHGHFYFSILKGLQKASESPNNLSIVEFGGGYGNLARILLGAGIANSYVIVDLPESLVFSYTFLRLNFPDLKVSMLSDASNIDNEEYDILLVPFELRSAILSRGVDIVINTGSLQEMPRSTAEEIMRFIEQDISCRYFFSVNYAFNAAGSRKELIQYEPREFNFLAPTLDTGWDVVDFQINPRDILVDSSRNWLKIFVKRDLDETRALPEVPSSDWTEEKEAQEWFASVWGRLWRHPDSELIDQYLDCIGKLMQGNYHIPFVIHNTSAPPELDDIGEVKYWTKIKKDMMTRSD